MELATRVAFLSGTLTIIRADQFATNEDGLYLCSPYPMANIGVGENRLGMTLMPIRTAISIEGIKAASASISNAAVSPVASAGRFQYRPMGLGAN